jgi:Uri superfamily endonuclease
MIKITILGSETQCGAYILRICVQHDLMVRFGRFQGGRMIRVPQGDVVYIGSAMAQRGSMTLASRLLRHATRSDQRRPQPIREEMLEVFAEVGLGTAKLEPPDHKKLSWNIDHLLEEESVELSQVFVLRTMERVEDSLAQFMEAESGTSIIKKGLGAHDRPGHTHLFHVRETAEWWRQLPIRLAKQFYEEPLKTISITNQELS